MVSKKSIRNCEEKMSETNQAVENVNIFEYFWNAALFEV